MLDQSLATQESLPLDHSPNSKNWYVAATKPGKIPLAIRHLNEQDFHTFCPLIAQSMMVRLPRNGRGSSGHAEKIITRPLFTNYLFIQIDILRQPWQRINFTRGIRHLLTGASNKIDDNNDPIEQTPIPIKATVINYLLKNPIHYANPGPFLFQRVKLLTPILMNEVGTITQISKHTIEVLLDSTNHTVRTPKSQIERIEGHDGERKLEGP